MSHFIENGRLVKVSALGMEKIYLETDSSLKHCQGQWWLRGKMSSTTDHKPNNSNNSNVDKHPYTDLN